MSIVIDCDRAIEMQLYMYTDAEQSKANVGHAIAAQMIMMMMMMCCEITSGNYYVLIMTLYIRTCMCIHVM